MLSPCVGKPEPHRGIFGLRQLSADRVGIRVILHHIGRSRAARHLVDNATGFAQVEDAANDLGALELDRVLKVCIPQTLIPALVVDDASRSIIGICDFHHRVHAELPRTGEIAGEEGHFRVNRFELRNQSAHRLRVPDGRVLDRSQLVFGCRCRLDADGCSHIDEREHPSKLAVSSRIEPHGVSIPGNAEVADGSTQAVLEQLATLLEIGEPITGAKLRITLNELLRGNRIGDELEHAIRHVLRFEVALELQRLIESLQVVDSQLTRRKIRIRSQVHRQGGTSEGGVRNGDFVHVRSADVNLVGGLEGATTEIIRLDHLGDLFDPLDDLSHLLFRLRPSVDLVEAQHVGCVRLSVAIVGLPSRSPANRDFVRGASSGDASLVLGGEHIPFLGEIGGADMHTVIRMLGAGEGVPTSGHDLADPSIVGGEPVHQNVVVKMRGPVEKKIVIGVTVPTHKIKFRLCVSTMLDTIVSAGN